MLFILEWMDAYLFRTLYAGYFFSSCIFVVCVFLPIFFKKNAPLRTTLRLSNSLDPDQFSKMSGLIWTNAFCKDYKQKAIAILYLYLVDIHRCFVDAPPLMRCKRA